MSIIDIKSMPKNDIQCGIKNEVIIRPRYFGCRIIVSKKNGNYAFLNSKKERISDIDILISDMYDVPMKIIKKHVSIIPDGVWHFTYNYKNGKLYSDKLIADFGKDIICVNDLLNGSIDETLSSYFVNKHVNKIAKHFKIDSDVTALMVKGDKNFQINFNRQPINEKASDMFGLVLADVVVRSNIQDLDMVVIGEDSVRTYINMIDILFMKYIENTIFDIPSLDMQYPYYMRSTCDNKTGVLNKNMVEYFSTMSKKKKYYNIYVLMLISFRKIAKIDIMTPKVKEKYLLLFSRIQEICKNGIFAVKAMTYSEMLNK